MDQREKLPLCKIHHSLSGKENSKAVIYLKKAHIKHAKTHTKFNLILLF